MKHFKKMMALIIALVMVVGTLSTMSSAFAAAGDLTPDATITITGLDAGDTVNLYKILNWVSGEGWRLTTGYEALTTSGNANYVQHVKDLIDNKSGVELTKEDLDKIAKVAKAAKTATPAVAAVDTKTVDSDTYTYSTTSAPGMYLALVQPGTAGVLYNPIVVSADFKTTPNTSEIDASSAKMGTSSVAKKTKDTVDKTEPKITNDIGDTYEYTVKTTVPVYSDAFNNTYFTVSDKVSQYLDIDSDSFKINGTAITVPSTASQTAPAVTVDDDKHGFTINYNDAFIKNLATPLEITIVYQAKLNIPASEAAKLDNVHEEYNEVSIEFPNNPNDDTDKTAVKDGTIEYTFTIDGNLLGHTDWRTTEWVKVGRDANGDPIESMIKYSSGEEHPALDGALFGLYKNKSDADAATATNYQTGLYKNDVFQGTVETKDHGLLNIPGLDAGEYYLKELTAPEGYIKDQQSHKIEIIPEYAPNGKDVTEWYTVVGSDTDNDGKDDKFDIEWSETDNGGIPVTYNVPVLTGYSVKIDDVETKKYQSELDGPHTSKSTVIKSSDAELLNTEGVELPSTGGIGTTLFYVIGAILVIGAGVLLVTRRRMDAD